MHAREVVCIFKSKAHMLYEFRGRFAIATTDREGLVVVARKFPSAAVRLLVLVAYLRCVEGKFLLSGEDRLTFYGG